jgi:hypothetical protein
MTADLASKLDALGSGVDFTNPETYQQLLYGEEIASPPAAPAPQGDSQTAAPVATPAEAPAAPAEAPAAVAPPAVASSEPPVAAEKTEATEAVDGVLTRDGKRVIPFEVLQQTRTTALEAQRRAQQLEATNQELQKQVEALQSGKADPAPGAKTEQFSKERIEALKADFPEMAELMESQNRLMAELASARKQPPAAPPPADDPAARQAAVQAEIDNHALLVKWQTASPLLWGRAREVDAELQADPAWAVKSLSERFTEVEKRVAAEAGFEITPSKPAAPAATASAAPTPPAAPAQPPTPAVPVVAEAPKPGISDFNGSPPKVGADPLLGVPVGKAVDLAMGMSVEELMRSVGVNT